MGNTMSQAMKGMKSTFFPTAKGLLVTDVDRAMVSIQRTKTQLLDHKRRQDMLATRSLAIAKQLVAEDRKDRALLALKKKKLHEKQAMQLDNNILLLEERMVALETTQQQADLMQAVKVATGAIKAMQRQTPLESIEQLLEENREGQEYVVQVNSLLAQQNNEGVPDSELEEELARMEGDAMPEASTHAATVATPADTTVAPVAAVAEEELASVPERQRIALLADGSVPLAGEAAVEEAHTSARHVNDKAKNASTAAPSVVAAESSAVAATDDFDLPDAPTHEAKMPEHEVPEAKEERIQPVDEPLLLPA